MKKLIPQIHAIIFLAFTSILFYQCTCGDSFKIIGSGSMSIKDLTPNPTDTITTAFNVAAFLEDEVVSTPCGDQTYENRVLMNSVNIYFSEDFIFKENTISSGTNLLDIQATTSEIELLLYAGIIEIRFNAIFIEQCSFPKGDYMVSLKATTNDDIEIENSINAYFDIQ